MEFIRKNYKNGLRTIFVPTNYNDICHFAVTIGAGTRREKPAENGLAHFIEHALFKGTETRKSFHILNRIDAVGGELNAFTTKEETCYYASFQSRYFERAVELLSDIIFNSVFPEKELEKEKEVIKDEINLYLDSPSEQIYDDFEEKLFGKHPLGMSILGTQKSLDGLGRKQALDFTTNYYLPANMVISASGPLSESLFNSIAEKYFGSLKSKKVSPEKSVPVKFNRDTYQIKRNVSQSHFMAGSLAYGNKDKNRSALVLLNNILGGPGMNNRLNLNIREKFGFTYQIESSYQAYSDTGVFAVYFATDFSRHEKTRELVYKELRKLCDKQLTPSQLKQAKQQLMGQIALARENMLNVVLGIGKNLLVHDRADTFEEICKRVESLTASNLLTVANEVMNPANLLELQYLSKD